MQRRNAILVTAILLGGILVVAFFITRAFLPSGPKSLRVTVLDVGQGDAILIQTPAGQDVLIDGGPDASVLDGLGRHLGFFDRTIELMLLTNPDSDHFQGQIDALQRYRVRRIVDSGTRGDAASFRLWEERVAGEEALVAAVCEGQEFVLDQGMSIRFFNPPCETAEGSENERSLVFTLTDGATVFLFMGDAPEIVEKRITAALPDVDVLKVGHHGSKTSTSEELLEKTKPETAIISSGKNNRYGHPHASVVERLEARGIRILRTDQAGDIQCASDGKTVSCD